MKSYRDVTGDGGSRIVAQVQEQQSRVAARLASVRHIVAVASGKGGVGKSSVTALLASALALRGHTVGILDADVNGSSIPKMTGVRGRTMERGTTGLVPPSSADHVKVVSIDLFLRDDRSPIRWDATTQHDAHTWRAMMEMGALREFLSDTEWGSLDYLLIDLPPGTDKLSNILDLLPRISGTLLVTIPTGVSEFVVGKSIRLARGLETPVIGLVENMASFVCPHCNREEALFPHGEAAHLAEESGIPLLERIPFDPRLAAALDRGQPYLAHHADAPAGRALFRLADHIGTFVAARTPVEGSTP